MVADAGADADLDGHGPGDAQAGARAGKSGGDKNGFKFKFQEAKAKHGDHATAESGADAEQVKGGAMVGYDEAPRKHEAGQRTGTGTLSPRRSSCKLRCVRGRSGREVVSRSTQARC